MRILTLLLVSCALSGATAETFDEEAQSLQILRKALIVKGFSRSQTPATLLWRNKAVYGLLNKAQKNIFHEQLECEARAENHERLKSIRNGAAEDVYRAVYKKQCAQTANSNTIASNSSTTHDVYHNCVCNVSNVPMYCEAVRSLGDLGQMRKDGPLICKDQVMDQLESVSNVTADFLRLLQLESAEILAESCSNFTKEKMEILPFLELFKEDPKIIIRICAFSVEVHRVLVELRDHDIVFRLYDDLLRKKALSDLSIGFCGMNYRYAKCICNERASALFCVFDFFKQSALIYLDEGICGNSASSHLPIALSILAVTIASLF